MSVAGNQRLTCLRLVAALRPHWRRDPGLPARMQALFARHPGFGSRDRRLYRELLYTTLRYLPWVEPLLDREPERAARITAWLAADNPATTRYRSELTAGWPSVPASVAERAAFLGQEVRSLLPDWMEEECPEAFAPEQMDAIHSRAPLWVRLQTDSPEPVYREFADKGWELRPSSRLPGAIEVLTEAEVTKTAAYREGLFEIQDLGSQMLLPAVGVKTGERWLDACAGAGGKSLQLARLVGSTGSVDAFDLRPAALDELRVRAQRARLSNVSVLPSAPAAQYENVLVDAPCSGSGTWRRSPHLKWTTTRATVAALAGRQSGILEKFSRNVAPGGRLVYATCSLSRSENEQVTESFLATHPEFRPDPFADASAGLLRNGSLSLLPAPNNADGYFVATLRRR